MGRLRTFFQVKYKLNSGPAGISNRGFVDPAGALGPLKAPRSPGVFGAKSFNLAISRHSILTCRNPRFPWLILKSYIKFYTNEDFNSHNLNKTSTLIVFIGVHSGGGGGSYEPVDDPPPPPPRGGGVVEVKKNKKKKKILF